MLFMADFETTKNEKDCRVWASAWINIDSVYLPNYGNTLHLSNNIEEFISYFMTLEGHHDCYFHNLKFDGSFIIDYLLRHGFVLDDDLSSPYTFNTLITEQKIFYQIKVRFDDSFEMTKTGKPKLRKGQPIKKRRILTVKDSLKKIPLKVSQIAKAYGIEEQKTSIDFEEDRPIGHVLTEQEKEYVSNDVIIVAKALHQMIHGQQMTGLTMSSDALNDFKHRLSGVEKGTKSSKKKAEETFRCYFPELSIDVDTFIRKSYKGGYTYANPTYQGQVVGQGLVYDVNSLYPSRMLACEMPYGIPKYVTGDCRIQISEEYPLYIQHLMCNFKLKPNHLPTIQLKNNSRYHETEYLTECDGIEELYLTSVDLKLFLEHYDVYELEYIDGLLFKSHVGFFDDYISYWGRIKKETKDKGERQLAKLMLNSLYGKFASSTSGVMKEPFLNEDDEVKYQIAIKDSRPTVYTALACFTTAWARDLMIRSAQACYERFLYCDTDSLHVLGFEEPEIDIHPVDLGAWKCEGVFHQAKYLRAKTYLESFYLDSSGEVISHPSDVPCGTFDLKLEVKCAGMPENVKEHVTYENFELGQQFGGKLMPKTVKGGIVLVEREFTIKH